MTKKFIPASFLALACACAYGATLTGGTSAANATSFGDYSAEDVTLNPPSSGSTGYFNGNNQTAQSVVAGGNASVSGGFNVNFDAGMYDYAIDASGGNLTLTNGAYSVKSVFELDDILVNTASGKTFTIASDATFNSNTDDLLIFQGGGAYSIAGKLNANSFDLRGSTLTQTGEVRVGSFFISNRNIGDPKTTYTVEKNAKLYTGSISMKATQADYNLTIFGYLKNTGELEVGSQKTGYKAAIRDSDGKIVKEEINPPAAFTIKSGATVDTDGLNIGSRVDIAGTLNVNRLTIPTSSVCSRLYIWEAGIVNVGATSSITETDLYGTLNINAGTTHIYKENGLTMFGGILNVKSGATLVSEKFTGSGNPYALAIGKSRKESGYRKSQIYVQSGGLLDLTQAQGGNDLSIGTWGSGAELTVKADKEHAIYLNKICVRDSAAELTINSKNIFRSKNVTSGDEGYNIMFLMGAASKMVMNVNAEVHFGNLTYQHSGALLTVNMGKASDVYLSFNDVVVMGTNIIANIVFNDFNNNRIYFESMDEIHDYVNIRGTGIDGTTLTKDDFYLVKDKFNGKDVYWLHSDLVVPEPAEWAAIFGAIALGLAARKRRRRA